MWEISISGCPLSDLFCISVFFICFYDGLTQCCAQSHMGKWLQVLEDLLDHLLVNGMVVVRVQCDAWTKYIDFCLAGSLYNLIVTCHRGTKTKIWLMSQVTGHWSLYQKDILSRSFSLGPIWYKNVTVLLIDSKFCAPLLLWHSPTQT